jgi:hypothetical protein
LAALRDLADRLLGHRLRTEEGWLALFAWLAQHLDLGKFGVPGAAALDPRIAIDCMWTEVARRDEIALARAKVLDAERTRARKCPASSGYLDEAGLAVELRRRRRNDRATLVEFMIGKDSASYLDVAHAIGDQKMTDDAIKKLAYRTSDSAVELRAAVRYSVGGGHVLKSLDED